MSAFGGKVDIMSRQSALFGLDARRADHLAPLLRFVGNELAVIGWRARQRRPAHVNEPRLDRWIGKTCVNPLVEAFDNFSGRALWRS